MVLPDQQEKAKVDLGAWRLSQEFVSSYLSAVGDELPAYFEHGLVPPVALAARALGALLEHLELPAGAIHSLQEIETIAPVTFGHQVSGTAVLSPPRRRGGMEFITAGFSLRDEDGRETLTGKSTVLVADPFASLSGASGRGSRTEGEEDQLRSVNSMHGGVEAGTMVLPTVTRKITQQQLDAYARVSGDFNPLHLDAEFASATRFGGIIAHGMLVLAFISEMMAAAFERAWLETGALKVRFKGAAYLGDRLEAQGRVAKEEPLPDGRRLGCAVGVINREKGTELISGTATVVLGW